MSEENVIIHIVKHSFPEFVMVFFRRLREIWWAVSFRDVRLARSAIGEITPRWRERIDDVLMCPDNDHIPRHPKAGQLRGSQLIMHNGIRVEALGYYGAGLLNMLIENRGVHEPQEERVFGDILPTLPESCTMIEAGAYWGFYSLWFASVVPFPKCHLIEPSHGKLQVGIRNFKQNGFDAEFLRAYVGAKKGRNANGHLVVSVDDYCRKKKIEHVTILHADIQGWEYEMLEGSKSMLANGKIGYIFISSHSNKLHYQCIDYLKSHGYDILISADMDETYSVDGLLVARYQNLPGPRNVAISKRTS